AQHVKTFTPTLSPPASGSVPGRCRLLWCRCARAARDAPDPGADDVAELGRLPNEERQSEFGQDAGKPVEPLRPQPYQDPVRAMSGVLFDGGDASGQPRLYLVGGAAHGDGDLVPPGGAGQAGADDVGGPETVGYRERALR